MKQITSEVVAWLLFGSGERTLEYSGLKMAHRIVICDTYNNARLRRRLVRGHHYHTLVYDNTSV